MFNIQRPNSRNTLPVNLASVERRSIEGGSRITQLSFAHKPPPKPPDLSASLDEAGSLAERPLSETPEPPWPPDPCPCLVAAKTVVKKMGMAMLPSRKRFILMRDEDTEVNLTICKWVIFLNLMGQAHTYGVQVGRRGRFLQGALDADKFRFSASDLPPYQKHGERFLIFAEKASPVREGRNSCYVYTEVDYQGQGNGQKLQAFWASQYQEICKQIPVGDALKGNAQCRFTEFALVDSLRVMDMVGTNVADAFGVIALLDRIKVVYCLDERPSSVQDKAIEIMSRLGGDQPAVLIDLVKQSCSCSSLDIDDFTIKGFMESTAGLWLLSIIASFHMKSNSRFNPNRKVRGFAQSLTFEFAVPIQSPMHCQTRAMLMTCILLDVEGSVHGGRHIQLPKLFARAFKCGSNVITMGIIDQYPLKWGDQEFGQEFDLHGYYEVVIYCGPEVEGIHLGVALIDQLKFSVEEIIKSFGPIQEKEKVVKCQEWNHIICCLQSESKISEEANDLLYECLKGSVRNSNRIAEKILMELSKIEEEGVLGVAKFGWHKPIVDHIIQGLESSRMSMAKTILKIELGESDLKGEQGVMPPLLEIFSGSLELKELSLSALVKLAGVLVNKRSVGDYGAWSLCFKLWDPGRSCFRPLQDPCPHRSSQFLKQWKLSPVTDAF